MALERPRALTGALCGKPPVQSASCLVCEEALGASAGPSLIADPAHAPAIQEGLPACAATVTVASDVVLDAPARAPPRA